MELTDEQLFQLTDCAIWNADSFRLSGDDAREELMQLNLLEQYKPDPFVHRHPSIKYFWKLTTLGHEILQKDRVRALSLLQWYKTIDRAYVYFEYLTIDELPLLLTHSNRYNIMNDQGFGEGKNV